MSLWVSDKGRQSLCMEEGGCNKCFSSFFFCCCSLLCSLLDKGKGLLLAVKPHQYLGSVRRWLFGDILENPEGKSILRVLLEWL